MKTRRAVYTRFTEDEFNRLLSDSENTGKPPQALLKERYFSKKPLIPFVPATEARKIADALNRMVSEINLIQLKFQQTPFEGLFTDLEEINRKISQIRAVIMTKLPDSLRDSFRNNAAD